MGCPRCNCIGATCDYCLNMGARYQEINYEYLTRHNHLHDGQPHVGDRVTTPDFVIRHQFDRDGDLLGGMPEIHPRFKL